MHRSPAEVNPLPVTQQLGEVGLIGSGIGGAGQLHHRGCLGIGDGAIPEANSRNTGTRGNAGAGQSSIPHAGAADSPNAGTPGTPGKPEAAKPHSRAARGARDLAHRAKNEATGALGRARRGSQKV